MGVYVSYLQATEAVLFYRGKDIDESKEFDVAKLLKWLIENVKLLRGTDMFTRNGKPKI